MGLARLLTMHFVCLEVYHNYVSVFTPRVQSAEGDTNDELTKRKALPTCELKFSTKATIQNIEKQVKGLELKIDELLNLLRKPQNGKYVVVNLRQLEATFTTVQRTDLCTDILNLVQAVASPRFWKPGGVG